MQTNVSWREVVSYMSSLLCSCRVCVHSASCDGSMLGKGLAGKAQCRPQAHAHALDQLLYMAIRTL